MPPGGWKRLLPPSIPFLFSLSLSLSTVGRHAFWQDSGFYLAAVHDLGVLYPPGFVLYQLLCRLWTTALPFLDFTLAVHLFSSFCAALAASALALGARDLLRSRGTLFRVTPSDPGTLADVCGSVVGCLAASGYSFWFAGLYAKGYSFYYLMLCLLLWRMIRADEDRTPRSFAWVALLIGLAWQAHPSATLTGPALLLFVFRHRSSLRWPALGRNIALAAAAAVGPSLALPLLASADQSLSFGDPRTPAQVLAYLAGSAYTSDSGNFGLAPSRIWSAGRYFWEEFLGIGAALAVAGTVAAARANRALLAGLAAWVLPVLVLTVCFTIEGQHDQWFVAAWLPLHLMAGPALLRLGRALPAAAAGAAACLWAVLANHADLNQRNATLPETYARIHLEPLDPEAVLLAEGDDAIALCRYLQSVRGVRRDVLVLSPQDLEAGRSGEPGLNYLRSQARDARLRPTPLAELRARHPETPDTDLRVAAFAHANAGSGRPIYFGTPPPPGLLPPGWTPAPAGWMFRLARGPEPGIDPKYWRFPVEPEQVASKFRRRRGQMVLRGPQGMKVWPQAYEERLMLSLLRARLSLGDFVLERDPAQAERLYGSALALHPDYQDNPRFLFQWGRIKRALGREEPAAGAFSRLLSLGEEAPRAFRAAAHDQLGEIHRKAGRAEAAEIEFGKARRLRAGAER